MNFTKFMKRRANHDLNNTEIIDDSKRKEEVIRRNKSISQTRIKQLLANDPSKVNSTNFLPKYQKDSKVIVNSV